MMAASSAGTTPADQNTGAAARQLEQLKAAGAAAKDETDGRPVDSAEEPCPLTNTTWIEIELVGEDGGGIADEVYIIVTPDEKEVRGKTDAYGVARLDDIAEGECRVSFPELDREAWEAAG